MFIFASTAKRCLVYRTVRVSLWDKKMKNFLHHTFSTADRELIAVIDELPLWSAPFGIRLLETIKLKKGVSALDIGCGLGFPLIEIAQRLGDSSKVIGIDPWKEALERCEQKIKKYNIKNAKIIEGFAEKIPFKDNYFDLIVSNNGINNVEDMDKALSECGRVCKRRGQFVLTMNLEDTMIEFYEAFEEVLGANDMNAEIDKMKEHIYSKRKPIEEVKTLLTDSGFQVSSIRHDSFSFNFLDAKTMFNHYLIKYWFLSEWKKIINEDDRKKVFKQTESRLSETAKINGELRLTVPYITIDCTKN
jgi:ubiquinone/menaquinone biosynthesis C-methylase UbiE